MIFEDCSKQERKGGLDEPDQKCLLDDSKVGLTSTVKGYYISFFGHITSIL